MIDSIRDWVRIKLGLHRCNDRSQMAVQFITGRLAPKCCREDWVRCFEAQGRVIREYWESVLDEELRSI